MSGLQIELKNITLKERSVIRPHLPNFIKNKMINYAQLTTFINSSSFFCQKKFKMTIAP
jgi:hypothetical protein